MRFKGLDLNLLVSLDILFEEQSVSRAADRLHLSQPAVSAALGRARTFFADELLIPTGGRMVPTPFGETLRPLVNDFIRRADGVVATSSIFDPRTSQRLFKIGASDFVTTVLILPLLRRLHPAAPGVRMEIIPTGTDMSMQFHRGEIDIIILPEPYVLFAHPNEPLFSEDHVAVGCANNPDFARPLTRRSFFASPHISITVGPTKQVAFAEGYLKQYEAQRRVEIFASSFSSVPWMLPGTNRLAVLQRRLARKFCSILPLTMAEIPIDIPPMQEMVQFHRSRTGDAGTRWLVGEIHNIINEIDRQDKF